MHSQKVTTWADKRKHHGSQTNASFIATNLLQKQGVSAYETTRGLLYIEALAQKGVLDPARKINCDLDFSSLGTVAFAEKFVGMISNREGIGNDMAEGFYLAAQRWGRLEQDLKTGLLLSPYWGLPEHGYDSRWQVCWGYSIILGDRDCNEHEFTGLFWFATPFKARGKKVPVPAESFVNAYSSKLFPFRGDKASKDGAEKNYGGR